MERASLACRAADYVRILGCWPLSAWLHGSIQLGRTALCSDPERPFSCFRTQPPEDSSKGGARGASQKNPVGHHGIKDVGLDPRRAPCPTSFLPWCMQPSWLHRAGGDHRRGLAPLQWRAWAGDILLPGRPTEEGACNGLPVRTSTWKASRGIL